MASDASEEGCETDSVLMARADTLEDELRELRQAPTTASLDADYDRRFMKAYRELTAGRVPNAIPKQVLKERLLRSLRNEQEGLKRVLAHYTDQIKTAEAEIAVLEDHNNAIAATKDATSPVPNEYHALKKLTSMRQRQIGHYLQLLYPLPQQLAHSSACNYLVLSEIFDRLLEASANRPEDRYIELSVEFWPPHVQVLLNANLVERHPHDSNRIRLRDWG
uniref:Protein containing CENP-K domain n=1 Tax=Rhipicephalus zambeziensis TaxID=60191 RepID=A0A224YF13_9ACAR